MKSIPQIAALLLFSALLAYSQDAPATLTTPHILGKIPDGTPPEPEPEKPIYRVAAKDILSTTTHEQGGRTITIREIKPLGLPQPPAPVTPAITETDVEFGKQAEQYRENHQRSGLLFLGATVFRSKDKPPVSLVRCWPEGGMEITFWTAADYSLIAGGINSFVDAAGDSQHLIMGWGEIDLDTLADPTARRLAGYDLPAMPDPAALANGGADLHIIGETPAAADIAPLQSLHEIYNSELAQLKTAYQGRERARIEHEAYLKANPPQPKDITLNFWRTETPAPNAKGESE